MMLPIPLDITALATISKMKYILITEVERLGLEPKLWATYINLSNIFYHNLELYSKVYSNKKRVVSCGIFPYNLLPFIAMSDLFSPSYPASDNSCSLHIRCPSSCRPSDIYHTLSLSPFLWFISNLIHLHKVHQLL